MIEYEIAGQDAEFDLKLCVSSGQVFRWEERPSGAWLGVDGDHWFLVERSADGCLKVRSNSNIEAFRSLFRLEQDLSVVEAEICDMGPELAPYIGFLPGLRLLRPSSPSESFFCFLCSANNNMPRIWQLVRKLANLGEPMAEVDGVVVHRFPTIEVLASVEEAELRALAFGYRAATIPFVAKALEGLGGEAWLQSLKQCGYAEAHHELCQLKGIGPKLADCIALFGLHHECAVPIDTHLWQAAVRLYFSEWTGKGLTAERYRRIGDHFRERFGRRAGWAHQYLFYENALRWRERGRLKLDTQDLYDALKVVV